MTLWEFSLSLYDKPGVPDACLTLQNRHNLDVNLVLFCLWLASDSRCLAKDAMQEVIARCDAWRGKMISPLRALRTEMKGWPSDMSVSDFSRRDDFEALRSKEIALNSKLRGCNSRCSRVTPNATRVSKIPNSPASLRAWVY